MARRSARVAALTAAALMAATAAAEAAPNGLLAFEVVQSAETCDQCGPDGNSETVGGGSRLWLVRPDGSRRRRLPCTSGAGRCADGGPAFSHDGRRLALTGYDGLVVMTPGGRELNRLEPFPGWSASWGPGGERLAFAFGGEGPERRNQGVAVTDLRGRMRVVHQGDAFDVAWSRQGRLAWTVWGAPRPVDELWVGDAAGRRSERIARRGRYLAWSPDGSRIAFLGEGALSVIDADGARRRVLTRACGIGYDSEGGVAWSPDGREIACRGRAGSLVVLSLRAMTLRRVVL